MKILMCSCYKDYFLESGHPIIKHLIHFHCKREDKDHDVFVHFCGAHPYGATIPAVVENDIAHKKCFCRIENHNRLREYCILI